MVRHHPQLLSWFTYWRNGKWPNMFVPYKNVLFITILVRTNSLWCWIMDCYFVVVLCCVVWGQTQSVKVVVLDGQNNRAGTLDGMALCEQTIHQEANYMDSYSMVEDSTQYINTGTDQYSMHTTYCYSSGHSHIPVWRLVSHVWWRTLLNGCQRV